MLNGVFTIPLPGQSQAFDASLPASLSRGGPLGEFIAGPENRLAAAALFALLSHQDATRPWSVPGGPLVFCGAPGAGKSHLAGALAQDWRRRDPAARVGHLLAAEYARELTHAIDTQGVREWESRYRQCDLLIVEDLDHLASKVAVQEHLSRTIDVLHHRAAQIIVTCSAHPAAMRNLCVALRSRLSGGLVIPLSLPGSAARRLILKRLASERRIAISNEGVERLAEGVSGGVRDLIGALVFLNTAFLDTVLLDTVSVEAVARDRHSGTAPSMPLSEQAISAYLASRREATTPSLATIAGRTSKYFALRASELRGPSRHRNVAQARNVAIYLARLLTGQSFEKIGGYFGGRDHTTALHAFRRVVELGEVDPQIRRAVAELRTELAC